MQTFVQQQKSLEQSRSNLQMKQSRQRYDGAGAAISSSAELAAAERTLNDGAQANMKANYQNLLSNSPGVVAPAKFQNVLNTRATSWAVIQRQPNGDEPDRTKKALGTAAIGTSGYFALTRMMAERSSGPMRHYGAEALGYLFGYGVGEAVKARNLSHYYHNVRHGGNLRALYMAPLLMGGTLLGWKGLLTLQSLKKKYEERQ